MAGTQIANNLNGPSISLSPHPLFTPPKENLLRHFKTTVFALLVIVVSACGVDTDEQQTASTDDETAIVEQGLTCKDSQGTRFTCTRGNTTKCKKLCGFCGRLALGRESFPRRLSRVCPSNEPYYCNCDGGDF
jgi:hypothetical protein